jgi:hypothetical protein
MSRTSKSRQEARVASLRKVLAALGLSALLMGGAEPAAVAVEQAVIVQFDYGSKDWSNFFAFEKQLEPAITKSGVGDYDSNELATDGSDGYMYFYGPDADKLFAVVKGELLNATFMKNIRVTIRYGAVNDKNAREIHIKLAS